MKKVLIINGHTDYKESVANRQILEKVATLMPEAEIVTLAELYPDFNINAEVEQKRLSDADIIVFQYPTFWYSAPSILHRYLEQVFLVGFALNPGGDKLHGKKLVLSLTSGVDSDMYSKDVNCVGWEMDAFIQPYKATAKITGMDYCGHIYTGGVGYITRISAEAAADQKKRSDHHAEKLVDLLNRL